MSEFKFDENVSLELIDPNPINPTIYSEDDIEHLAAKIKEEGFKHPVKLYDKGNGRYEISSGHRRVKAMRMLNKKTIPSIIVKMPKEEFKKTRELLSGNLEQRKTSPLEKAREIQEYRKSLEEEKYTGNKRSKIAEYFNITESNVYRYECILKLIPELQEYCKKPDFPYSSLRAAAALTKKEQHTVYEKLIELEASEKQVAEDDIDRDEIVFTRTRIEQIINNLIKHRDDTNKKTENLNENDSKTDSGTFINPPEDINKDYIDDRSEDLSEFVIDDESPTIDIEETNFCDEISIRGIEDCINTIKSYKKLTYNEKSKDILKKYIKDLKSLISQLESILD